MALNFKSLRSGSSGNCLMLWTQKCRILVDCGLGSQLAVRELLSSQLGTNFDIDCVLVTHTHSDHINYSALRVFQQYGIEIRVHEDCLGQLAEKHFNGYEFKDLKLKAFTDREFELGDLHIEPVALRHEPSHPTYGFCFRHGNVKMAAATDFSAGPGLLERMIDCDFVFIESNHDLKMLRQNPNYASKFHMPNPRTAEMLFDFRVKSKSAPKAVMLGHLSQQRNEPQLAVDTIKDVFEIGDLRMDFPLITAPRFGESKTIEL